MKITTKNFTGIKKSILLSVSLFLIASSSLAQKFGFIDSQYILDQIPEYKAAINELDKNAADWQKEIEAKYADIDKLYKIYQAEQFTLSDDLRTMKQNEIVNLETEVRELQKQRFGADGDLPKKRIDLLKPIQDKVDKAIRSIAEKEGLDYVFDKVSAVMVLYSNPKYDKSKDVLTFLGLTKPKS